MNFELNAIFILHIFNYFTNDSALLNISYSQQNYK